MVAGGMTDAAGRRRNMLRNLVLAGLTALLMSSLASSARAGRGGATRTTEASQHHAASETEAERPTRPAVRKKPVVVKVRSRASVRKRGAVRRFKAAALNTSLLRPSWTVADLNPMPALLDLDDTARNMRRATAQIVRMMTR
jgi:hypothetical protein